VNYRLGHASQVRVMESKFRPPASGSLEVRRDTLRGTPPEDRTFMIGKKPVIKWPAVRSPAKNRLKQFAQVGPARERLATL
jgi:hypothetical protein